jgi:YebC/PmpR family DNA-binding regulatory protein
MSGHSKWATTHRQKEIADAKKGSAFTKIANLIVMAVREGGSDLEANFKLRLAIDKARSANMPKDNIQRAIDKGAGVSKDGAVFEEITYEIIGPAGIGYIAESLTDNKNRTVSELKSVLNKNGAQLGATNSIAWNFERKGEILLDAKNLNDDSELAIIDAGADDIIKDASDWLVITPPEKLMSIANNLKSEGLAVKEASLSYRPKEEVLLTNPEDQEKVERLFNLIEDLDDITNVYTNANW